MKAKTNLPLIAVAATSLLIALDCLTGKAGNLEPHAPPQPTMVTLDQLSAQIDALSCPVKKVVRGVITFPITGDKELAQNFAPAIDPNHSVVLLSDAVASLHGLHDYDEWAGRTGACVTELTGTHITVRVEPHPTEQKVGYQIIEYK